MSHAAMTPTDHPSNTAVVAKKILLDVPTLVCLRVRSFAESRPGELAYRPLPVGGAAMLKHLSVTHYMPQSSDSKCSHPLRKPHG